MKRNISLNENLRTIIDIFVSNNYHIYLVGGVVRDNLLSRKNNDYDLTTDATPDEMIELFNDKYQLVLNGKKHGTIGIVSGREVYEVTTFRVDGDYLDNRHPENVNFVKSLKEDLARRDFTMNAMAIDLVNNELIDYFNGQVDINNKIIRTVNEPDKRFKEDALRILRALRFSATLGFEIEEKTSISIINNYKLLYGISTERMLVELKKMINGFDFPKIFLKYNEVFKDLFSLEMNGNEIDYVNKNISNLKDINQKLAIIFSFSNDLKTLLDKYHFSNNEKKEIIGIINISKKSIKSDKDMRILFNEYDEYLLFKAIEYKGILEDRDYHSLYNENIDKPNHIKDLKVNGLNLLNEGIKETDIGDILSILIKEVIEEKIENNKDILIKKANEIEVGYLLKDKNIV